MANVLDIAGCAADMQMVYLSGNVLYQFQIRLSILSIKKDDSIAFIVNLVLFCSFCKKVATGKFEWTGLMPTQHIVNESGKIDVEMYLKGMLLSFSL